MTTCLLADENFPLSVIVALEADGFDVLSVARESPSIDDRAVLELACRTGRCLLTFDSDFGDLVFFRGAPMPVAILYFRFHPIITQEILVAAQKALQEVPDGYFAVISKDATRLRPMKR